MLSLRGEAAGVGATDDWGLLSRLLGAAPLLSSSPVHLTHKMAAAIVGGTAARLFGFSPGPTLPPAR